MTWVKIICLFLLTIAMIIFGEVWGSLATLTVFGSGGMWYFNVGFVFILGCSLSLALGYLLYYVFRGVNRIWLLNYHFYRNLFHRWFP